ncbi:Alpha/beta knot methyltransferase [Pelagophyceae sp. CCMP2097]|nr:Alpha/beta knot methyltransferase [Pelagophyceae sp. CCMP2097]|mmetsp:Transcript_28751/g.96892  ORF Transcript_28751/g.96892 Transcript_28751/m.96892 type:complete len:302 (+) Transcript_28751:57-962(+)
MRLRLAAWAVCLASACALRLGGVSVVLVGPQYASNVGAVARLCANFEVGRLILVAPEYDREAEATFERRFAMPAGRQVLAERSAAVACLADALTHVDAAVAFSRRAGANRQLGGLDSLVPQLALQHNADGSAADGVAVAPRRVALVFGREADGLTTAELAQCGSAVAIDCDGSLNLPAAVAIALCEAHRGAPSATSEAPAAEAAAPDRHSEALVSRVRTFLNDGAADDADRFLKTSRGKVPLERNSLDVVDRLLQRSRATSAEVDALHKLFAQVEKKASNEPQRQGGDKERQGDQGSEVFA